MTAATAVVAKQFFPDERQQSVVCTRFRIEETDAMARAR